MQIFNPEPNPGLSMANFRKICENGFGDGYNAYAHSMAWFQNYLYVGTTRANFCLIRNRMTQIKIDLWPVECRNAIYSPEFEHNEARAEIWRYDPVLDHWERVFQAPMVLSNQGEKMSRDLGYRGMVVFQGKSDRKPALYTTNWSRSRGPGPVVLRSEDGKDFVPVSQPGLIGLPINTLRLLVPFKGRLFTAPTGTTQGNPNTSGIPIVYESSDPAQGEWQPANEPGFGDLNNLTIFELLGFGDYLYAGTLNNNGFQIWRTLAEGKPPYKWSNVIANGAERGSLNQAVASLVVFKDALYVGTGIQNGGYDRLNKIGPAGSEIIRIHHDGSWELIVADARNDKKPLSGLEAGFQNVCAGYIWRMGTHNGWLYAGTMDWSIIMRFSPFQQVPGRLGRVLDSLGIENIIKNRGGVDLWRTYDGENWLPVSRQGLGNPYNFGIRNIVSTPHGLFIGTANPFGKRVAARVNGEWTYVDNPDGGLEVWLGK